MTSISAHDTGIDIRQYLTNEIPSIQQIPTTKYAMDKALEYIDMLQSNTISKSEFDDLIDDLTNIEDINEEMFTVECYREIAVAFKIITTLKTIVSII
jgi:hypothetical protein